LKEFVMLNIAQIETVYDTLAQAIDQAGPDQTELFLVKLAMLQAQALGNETLFAELTQRALKDL
jgi:hypothetical protein